MKAYYSGDGQFDATTSNAISLRVGGIGQAGFQSPITMGGLSFRRSIAVADLNGDGIADLVVDDFDKNQISVLFGKGDGSDSHTLAGLGRTYTDIDIEAPGRIRNSSR